MNTRMDRIEATLLEQNLESIIGIPQDNVIVTLERIADYESIIDYHGRTRRVKLRFTLYTVNCEDPWSFVDGPVLEIRHFCVSPQNKGYGTKFITHLTQLLTFDIDTIILQAMNVRAATFWERLGFYFHPLMDKKELRMYLQLGVETKKNTLRPGIA